MGTEASTVTAQQIIEDWYAGGRTSRDPHDDLGVLISEIKRLRGSLWEIRGFATDAYTYEQADGALDRIVRVVNDVEGLASDG